MQSSALTGWIFSSLFLSLRVSPVFALAPPFSLTRVPAPFRAFFGVAIAACIAAADPAMATIRDFSAGTLVVTAARELMLGMIFVMAFQLMFGALYMAGRTIDIQAGYGLALLIDQRPRPRRRWSVRSSPMRRARCSLRWGDMRNC